ncbi:hypothetical protein JCM11251_001683, partial [Rhodosporidiobolus azoricus]
NAADHLTAFTAALTSPPPRSLATDTEIEEEAAHLTLALQFAAETAPLSNTRRNPRFANPWWTDETAKACETARKARNRLTRLQARGIESDEKRALEVGVKSLKARVKALVRREKALWERQWVEETTAETLWKKVKSALGRGGGAGNGVTPPLRRPDGTFAVSLKDKVDVLCPLLLPVIRQQLRHQPKPTPVKPEGGAAMDEGIQVSQSILCMMLPSLGGAPPPLHLAAGKPA